MTISLAPRTVTLGLVVLVGGALALALTPAPTVLRALVVVPVLIGVAGSAATRLVLGPPPGDDDAGTDALLRTTLPIVLGTVVLLAAVLAVGAAGVPVAAPGIACVTAAAALVLVMVARWPTLPPRRLVDVVSVWVGRWRQKAPRSTAEQAPGQGRAREPSPWQRFPRTSHRFALPGPRIVAATASVVGAVVVLGAAVAGAIALQPAPVERYTQIALDGAPAISGAPLTARPNGVVTVDFSLSGYGGPLAVTQPQVDITVGGAPARSPLVITKPPVPAAADTGAVDVQTSSVTFLAPPQEGLYTVRITAGPTQSVLVATLKVIQ